MKDTREEVGKAKVKWVLKECRFKRGFKSKPSKECGMRIAQKDLRQAPPEPLTLSGHTAIVLQSNGNAGGH